MQEAVVVMYKKWRNGYVDLSKVVSYERGYKDGINMGGPWYTLEGITADGQKIELDKFRSMDDLDLAMRSLAVQLASGESSIVCHHGSKCMGMTESVENERLSIPESLAYVGKFETSMTGLRSAVMHVYLDKHNNRCYFQDKDSDSWYDRIELAIHRVPLIDRRLKDSLNKCMSS